MDNQKRNEKGFTMVELIIVVAIIGIIGALLVPSFGTMSSKARLTTDISTVKILKRTADSYKAEQGEWPTGDNLTELAATLHAESYLDSASVDMQTKTDVAIDGVAGTIKLDTASLKADTYLKAYQSLDDAIKTTWCTGNPAEPSKE